jgi:site-specific DNA-cytosine methylase
VTVAHVDVMPTMTSGGSTEASHNQMSGQFREGYVVPVAARPISPTLTSNYGKQVDSSDTALGPNVVWPGMQVRRLTPTECERLQGFPDGHTLLPGRHADGPRYKALGNSMAVPCMRWIGGNIG